MALLRITRFTADPADAAELRDRHAALVTAIRSAAPGPAEAHLARVDERTWVTVWRFTSQEDVDASFAVVPTLTEATAAFALTSRPRCGPGGARRRTLREPCNLSHRWRHQGG